MDLRSLWQAVLGELEVSISRANFATWFKHTSVISNESGHVVVAVPNIFTKEWLEKKYHNDIKAAITKIVGQVQSIEYKVKPISAPAALQPMAETLAPEKPARIAARPAAVIPPSSLNGRYTFDNFVVGSSNELAYAAAQAVTKNPGQKYNPLYIYGGVGLGKTHLMQAIGNQVLRQDPSKRVEYATSEGFTNEFLSCLSRKRGQDFADKFRSVDVLIIDDIQFFAGKEKTVEEFFHTFNTLHQANKQIILSSDRPPQAISGLEDRIRSRFASGMIADIQAPDLETRSAILINKASAQGVHLPVEVVEYLARHIQSNIRELEGALTQLIAYCELREIEPSIAAATGLLGSIASNRARLKPVTAKTVLEKTAGYFDLGVADLTGPKRDREIVVPRQIAMYLMRHELSLSFPKIASVVGGRDHTTAMHSVTKIEKQLESDENLRSQVNLIKERLHI